MFTIKFYDLKGRERILSAVSFTVIDDAQVSGGYEITVHQSNSADDDTHTVGAKGPWVVAYIVNANGKTVATYRTNPVE